MRYSPFSLLDGVGLHVSRWYLHVVSKEEIVPRSTDLYRVGVVKLNTNQGCKKIGTAVPAVLRKV